MNDLQIEKLKKTLEEVMKVGYGKVTWEITVLNGKITTTSLTKTTTSKIA